MSVVYYFLLVGTACVLSYFLGRSHGRQNSVQKEADNAKATAAKKEKIRTENAKLSDSAIFNKLRKYTRKL